MTRPQSPAPRRWRRFVSRPTPAPVAPQQTPRAAASQLELDLAPNDPLIAYCQQAGSAVDVEDLELDSPGLRQLKASGAKLVVPLVTQGELIGLLNLGPRLSEQDYSGR